MEDPVSHGHAFVVGDLWRAPSQLLQAHEQFDSIFEPLDTSTTRLGLPEAGDAPHFHFDTDLPALPDLDVVAKPQDDCGENSLLLTKLESDLLDVWNLDHASFEAPKISNLCTWEAFDGKSVANAQHTAFVSEAGQAAFDALNGTTNKEGVLPQDYTLRALCSLAHGRSSTLFHWNEEIKSFATVLPGVSTSGTSHMCAQSLTNNLIEMGTSIVRLREFGSSTYSSRNVCSAMIAMQNSIVSVLEAIDEVMCRELRVVRSLLQLQQRIVQPQQLLAMLGLLVESVRDCNTDESIISALSDCIHSLVQTNEEYSAVLQAFLARVSVPWLERLSVNLGLRRTNSAVLGMSNTTQDADEFTREDHAFLDDIDIDLVRETKIAVTLLRELSPNHPLLGSFSSGADSSLESLTNPDSSLEHTKELAQRYEARIVRQMKDGIMTEQNAPANVAAKPEMDDHRPDERSQEIYINDLTGLMSQTIGERHQQVPDELRNLAILALQEDPFSRQGHGLALSTSVNKTPLERVRPFVRTQNRLINGVLLRQLLRDHHLRQQLETQKQFQLLGSGDFVSRLSTALFSLDVQSAERRRGVIPTGEIMGLRLGSSSEQRWPPASSELRLTLAGVLEESQGLKIAASESRGDHTSALSFAIRELPEEEIDRVLDVHSVHALDFLRLQYVPASPLDAIFTPNIIQQYDAVFRFLLKLLRQIHVVKSLPRRKAGSHGDATNEKLIQFSNESHHFVSVLMAHSMELGINAPWRVLMTSIGQLEQALQDEDSAGEIGTKAMVGIQGLKQMHEACLDRIRSRLLLKRKQVKLRTAIEAVFTATLQCAAVVTASDKMDRSAFEEQYRHFRQACAQLCDMLQQAVDKPPKAMTAAESEDADTIRVLLTNLNWNDFYLRV